MLTRPSSIKFSITGRAFTVFCIFQSVIRDLKLLQLVEFLKASSKELVMDKENCIGRQHVESIVCKTYKQTDEDLTKLKGSEAGK